jgi:hypothetical protein
MVYLRCCQQFRPLAPASNDRAIVSNELDNMWKEADGRGVTEGRTEINQDKHQDTRCPGRDSRTSYNTSCRVIRFVVYIYLFIV